jgi:hypothetical protein
VIVAPPTYADSDTKGLVNPAGGTDVSQGYESLFAP